ncbi:hypothetical protein L7F22_005250 [Adiantum nelumboides]|nr:hypothetical protein [Adiantum nelumboides]
MSVRDKWKKYGYTLAWDGWLEAKGRPIIKVMATSIHGSIFVKSNDTNEEYKLGEYIFGVLKDVIEEMRHENVVQICMDNATNCVLVGSLIEAKWPSSFFTKCTCHCLDLLF